MDFGRWYFWIHAIPEGQSFSRFTTYSQAAKNGCTILELEGPELPELGYNVWSIFERMRDVSYAEISAYQHLTGDMLEYWEIDSLMRLNGLRGVKVLWQMKK